MHFHPRAMPNRAFTRQAFFRVWRRFKQEDVHRLLHSPSFATKPKTGSSERRDELETRETRLFADLPHGRFRERLAEFLVALRKRPSPVRVFNKKDLDRPVLFAVDNSAGGRFMPAGPSVMLPLPLTASVNRTVWLSRPGGARVPCRVVGLDLHMRLQACVQR